jgi:co-chaperonin GroES (HSP10)
MENQRLDCKDGDTVTIEAYRGKIDGKEYWIASSLDCKGSRVVLLDGGRDPAWDR